MPLQQFQMLIVQFDLTTPPINQVAILIVHQVAVLVDVVVTWMEA